MQRETTLSGLIEGLGYEVVRVESAPRGLDVPVGDPVIHDRLAGTSIAASDVVLAVGVDPRGPELLDLLESAGRSGAAAVIAKLIDGPESSTVVAAAERAEVALLRLSRDVEWGQFHALIRMLTSTSGTPRDGEIPLGDLFALANAIAVRAHGSVTIEDAQSRVLAYSTGDDEIDEYRRDTILGRRVPDSWVRRLQNDGVFQRIWRGEGPVRIAYSPSEPGYRDRLVIAVRAGGEVVGSIWIQEGSEPLGEEHEHLLREVAPLAASTSPGTWRVTSNGGRRPNCCGLFWRGGCPRRHSVNCCRCGRGIGWRCWVFVPSAATRSRARCISVGCRA